MTIDKIHDRIDFITSKESGGYNTPGEKDTALDMAQMWVFNDYLPMWGKSQTANEALAPFLTELGFSTDSSGVYAVSSSLNFMRLAGIYAQGIDSSVPSGIPQIRKYEVTQVNADEEAAAYMSQENAVSSTNPIFIVTGLGAFKFYPEEVIAGKMRFLRRPATPVYAFSQVGRAITYTSVGSTQMEWNDLFINRVIAKALSILGVNLDNQKLIEYGLTYPQ